MTLDDILSSWEIDSKIDKSSLDEESNKVPELHHKYLKLYSNERLIFFKLETEYKKLYKIKLEYYQGRISQEDLLEKGWKPFSLKLMRDDIQVYIDSDADISNLQLKLQYSKEKISALDSILKSINFRNNTIKNTIDFLKFTQGS